MMDIFHSDSEYDIFSESGSSEDHEESEILYGGQAQRILSSLEESIGKIDDYLTFERVFEYGDVICRVADRSGQMGRVVNVDMLVDLENLHGKVVKGVNSKKLSKIRSISANDYVINGSWIGRVTKVVDRVSVLFNDGAKCEVTALDQEKLMPVSPNLLEDSQYPYYPGQRVEVRISTTSTPGGWFCRTWKENRTEGTVCGVKPGLVYVEWLGSALACEESKIPAPPELQDPKDLTLFSCYSHANWQLGDWCILTITESKLEQSNFRKGLSVNYNTNSEEVFVIIKTKTKFDVLWQDGSKSFELDASSLLPKDAINTHEFFPGQFVLEKGACDYQDVSGKERWGFVLGVDAKEQTVKVKWKSFPQNGTTDVSVDWIGETVSAYSLVEHPDYCYSLGDVVFRSPWKQLLNHPIEDTDREMVMGQDSLFGDKECSGESGSCYLPCIGNVTGFEDGAVEVRWASGVTCKVAPFEIYLLEKYQSPTQTAMGSGEAYEQLNEETDQDTHSSDQEWKGLINAYSDVEHSKMSPCKSGCSLAKFALGHLPGILGNLFGFFCSSLLPGSSVSSSQLYRDDNKDMGFHEKEPCDCCTETQRMLVDELQGVESTSFELKIKKLHEVVDVTYSSVSMVPDRFRHFDMVNDCSDHHFFDVADKGCALTQVHRSWLKNVQKEWSILEKNLPETIYVRIYEERMDLMRAAIVGTPGTPYHDGLFFFDFYLPPDYPHQPPMVYYHSRGLTPNPNLYESGKVCLSLLNTWMGTSTEVWNPGSSTVLQILLSLQALVLNEKPYFNEAGYESQIGKAEGEKNSVSYNENAFLVNCKLMLHLLHKPPKNFEPLVEEHFKRRSHQILLACKAYMNGLPVGYASGNYVKEDKGCSTGFKIMLAKIFPKLVEAFAGKGIDCSQFEL